MERLGVLVTALAILLLGTSPASGSLPQADGRTGTSNDPWPQGVEVFTGSGFDTCRTPSTRTMRAWLESPYRAVGVYFGGRGRACPKQPNLTPRWVTSAHQMGWRILPLYVGSQAPCVVAKNKRGVPIDAARPRAAGAREGRDAVRRARALGLSERSALYLDMEHYRYRRARCAAITLAFVQGWNREVRRQGFVPGFYSSADSGVRHMEKARRAGRSHLPQVMWFARWSVPPSVDDEPSLHPDAWQPHRRIHQYAGDVRDTYGGKRMAIDRNKVDAPVAVVR